MEVDGNNKEPVDPATAHLSRIGQARVRGAAATEADPVLVAGGPCNAVVPSAGSHQDKSTKEEFNNVPD
ncbi:MAG: hypothetical protein M3O74_06790 [Pseudomonadota bacterium]|nr:hypothetical protein [Pseudomonadota bacterium]